ncbi:YppF family protein [Ectobacillus antri]|jgi:hypothetical protein|uniref:YppF family protein n=1 Tax=Ectobacillus antri TaxID=2486280 RepID=A0ABT6H1F4_9BACI|nr:YppF family protein [Ectobacillus antri]MDG4656140.1 YppF family protein [Ectobacillus antri]MDG5752815.1 YppF family protein [Ectobacillus antri]
MTLGELRTLFIGLKQYEPVDSNELLDFARQSYLKGELALVQYRDMIRELEALGAKKPDYELEGIIHSHI